MTGLYLAIWAAFAQAEPALVAEGEPLVADAAAASPDVVQTLAPGVQVNWSRHLLLVDGDARPYGTQSRKAVEQLARREIDARVQQSGGLVQVADGVPLTALLADADLGPPVAARLGRWEVSAATYYASGRVSLLAEADLTSVIKPWTVREARPLRPGPPPSLTVVVDAREVGATPCFSTRVLAEDGAVVFDGRVEAGAAVRSAPARWVRVVPEAAPSTQRTTVIAVAAAPCGLVVDATAAARLALPDAQDALAAGQLVVLAP